MKDHAPSAERNRHDILPALEQTLPQEGLILEIASGTGQHAVHFAPRFPQARWQPTDRKDEALASIRAWTTEEDVANILAPVTLDVTWQDWPVKEASAIVNINMLHISPWDACRGLMQGAARTLESGAPLFYYGAFFRRDRETAPSNLEFDRSLRERNPEWGVRNLEDVTATATEAGLTFVEARDMPNNNYAVIFRQP